MTEEDAKTTQCCGPEGCGFFNTDPRPARWCVGSACMAWRWIRDAEYRTRANRAYERDGQVLRPNEGHCGLAGAPQ